MIFQGLIFKFIASWVLIRAHEIIFPKNAFIFLIFVIIHNYVNHHILKLYKDGVCMSSLYDIRMSSPYLKTLYYMIIIISQNMYIN